MSYSKIKINGYCDVNFIWSKKDNITDEEITAIVSQGIQTPLWDTETVTLATFKEDLSASDINQKHPIEKYAIQRHDIDENIKYTVAIVDSVDTKISDYNVGSNAKYEYIVSPIHKDSEGKEFYADPIVSPVTEIKWDYWTIVGLSPTVDSKTFTVNKTDIWRFHANIEPSTFSINNGKKVLNGFGKFPKVYSTEEDYLSFDVNCLFGTVECASDYSNDDIKKLKKWRQFCNNGKLKLLKDYKGHVIPCEIIDIPTYTPDNKTTTISFKVIQLMDADNISAYGLEM